jgi:ribosomal protein S27E
MSVGFAAKFAGRCGSCGQRFEPGDEVFYDQADTMIGMDCCGDRLSDPSGSDLIAREPVMPRGKVARDKCPHCFQIPASNGVCGCH